ncbi:MAG TPA: hypothetical protein VGG84_09870 [Gemmatimonadaceae bacterium]
MNVRLAALGACLALATSCGRTGDDTSVIRGRGLQPAGPSADVEARMYEQAIRAAFDVGPDLVLLMHPSRLPRRAEDSTGGPLPDAVLAALRTRGLVRGTCIPRHEVARDTPRCESSAPGYVIRGSEVFRVGGDTAELYLAAEQFAPAKGIKPQALRFEKIYQLVPDRGGWRVAREGRVHERP